MALLRVRLAFGVLLAINVMALHFSFYTGDLFGAAADSRGAYREISGLFAYLILFLTSIVYVLLGLPILSDAWTSRRRTAGVPLPTAPLLIWVGVSAAFAISVGHTLRGYGRSYYDTVVMVLVIVTLGHYLEARARRRTAERMVSALDGLPETLEIRRGDFSFHGTRADVRRGDRIRIRPGEAASVDGTIVSGSSHVDTKATTGESRPVALGPGDPIVSGTTLVDGELWVEASGGATEGRLAGIQRTLDRARHRRPRIQRTADRLASFLMPGAVLLSLVCFGWGVWTDRPEDGLLRGLSVLLIACPCAFAIAPSLGLVGVVAAAARRGVVIASPEVVERIAAVRSVFFDKTGTLSGEEAEVVDVRPAPGVDRREAIVTLAALESASRHPIARGFARFAESQGVVAPVPDACRVLPGLGIEGRLGGRTYRAGITGRGAEGGDGVCLSSGSRILATVGLRENPRSDADSAIRGLRDLRLRVAGLSGDRRDATQRLATRLGIPNEAELQAEDKLDRLEAERRSPGGRRAVMMVGDGINDAPALAAADVGVALGEGTELSRQAGHVLLTENRLEDLPFVILRSRSALARIRTVLAASLAYNLLGIGLAMAGRLQPAFAASAMVVSSLLVLSCSGRK